MTKDSLLKFKDIFEKTGQLEKLERVKKSLALLEPVKVKEEIKEEPKEEKKETKKK